jgi:hypothetical protein
MNCPKCGSEKSMRGPRYVSTEKGERLVTRCRVCRYTTTSPCADSHLLSLTAINLTDTPTGKKPVVTIQIPPGEEK